MSMNQRAQKYFDLYEALDRVRGSLAAREPDAITPVCELVGENCKHCPIRSSGSLVAGPCWIEDGNPLFALAAKHGPRQFSGHRKVWDAAVKMIEGEMHYTL